MSEQLFLKASRLKLRFNCERGSYLVEDLWDLPIQTKTGAGVTLDGLYRQHKKELEELSEEGLFQSKSSSSKSVIAQLKVDIIRFVAETKQAEADKKQKALEAKAKRERLAELIAQKQDAALLSKDVAELQAELKKLDEEEGADA